MGVNEKRARRHLRMRENTMTPELEMRNRQMNVVWPGPLVNGTRVDKLVFKGSPNASPLQRIGMLIFGLHFLFIGVAFVFMGTVYHLLAVAVYSLPFFALGARILYNAFRSKNRKRPNE